MKRASRLKVLELTGAALSDEDMRDLILRVLSRLDARGAFSAPDVPIQLESMGGELWRTSRDSWSSGA